MTVGQLMLGLDRPENFSLFMLASILVSLATVPIALIRAEAPAPIRSVKIRVPHLYRLSPVGVVGCLAVGLANGAFWSLAPVFAQEKDADTWGVAVFMRSVEHPSELQALIRISIVVFGVIKTES